MHWFFHVIGDMLNAENLGENRRTDYPEHTVTYNPSAQRQPLLELGMSFLYSLCPWLLICNFYMAVTLFGLPLCWSLFKAEVECTTAYLRGQPLQVRGPCPWTARQGIAPFVHVPPRSGFPGSQAALGKHKFSEQPSEEDCLASSLLGGWGVTVSDGKRSWHWPSN